MAKKVVKKAPTKGEYILVETIHYEDDGWDDSYVCDEGYETLDAAKKAAVAMSDTILGTITIYRREAILKVEKTSTVEWKDA